VFKATCCLFSVVKTAFIRYNSDIPALCFDYKYDNSEQLLDRENPLSVQIYLIMGHCDTRKSC